jgi:CRISPR-associated exonuclease Cas4
VVSHDEEKGPTEGPQPLAIGGTWIWYYAICQREVWLMAHAITPDEDDDNLEYGRFLHERAFSRDGDEVSVGVNKMDRVVADNGSLIVVEIKKSSRAIDSARLQLANYLMDLEERGVPAQGELRFPEEHRRETLILDDAWRRTIRETREAIAALVATKLPPPPKRIPWCRQCAYRDFCWTD